MKELVFILGGARSGKSTHAERLALEQGGQDVLYVATAQAWDDEMRARIAAHQEQRSAGWRTIEAPLQAGSRVPAALGSARVVLVDCLTLLVSNAVLALGEDCGVKAAESAALAEVTGLIEAYNAGEATWIVVSNEVGLGIVPAYPLGRVYRDALGRANQRLAAAADQVLFMVAGLPLRVK